MLDSSSLVEHPDNEYLFGMEGIERLAEGMRKVGFRGAIEVWDMKDGSFLIYSGARRNRAKYAAWQYSNKGICVPLSRIRNRTAQRIFRSKYLWS